ncbi:MAG: hypothetical protein K0B87_05675 [Candidatus Syntrophosphaera sp.]|nr:hypothetical protein [Candidatus Syntrophosphaera sp.]
MKAIAILAMILSFVALSGVMASSQSSDLSPPGYDSGENFAAETGDGSQLQRQTNTWTGMVSTNWHSSSNWSLNHVPTSSETVVVPGSLTRYPVVSGTAVCYSLTVNSGASITISTDQLTVHTNFTNHGLLAMTSSSANLQVNQSLFFESGSSTNITADAWIRVQLNVEFNAGSNVNMANGNLAFWAAGNSSIRTRSSTTINHLWSAKSAGSFASISNVSTHDLTINGNINVEVGSALYHPYSGYTYLKGDIAVGASGIVNFNAGALAFTGNTDSRIWLEPDNYLHNVVVLKDAGAYVRLRSNINVRNLSIQSGILTPLYSYTTGGWPPILVTIAYNITLRGNWTNNAGPDNFAQGSGSYSSRVTLTGTANQTIGTETFAILELDKSGGAMLIPSGSNVTCASYDWTQGAYSVTGGTFTALDLADPGIFGTITLSSGTINYHQDDASWIDLNANLTISGGTFNVMGGNSPSYFSYLSTATLNMSGGVLDFHDESIEIHYVFNHNITSGTIRTSRSFRVYRNDFNPSGGTIELYGSADASLLNTAGSNFHNLTINKSAMREEPEHGQPEWETLRDGSQRLLTRANTVTASGPVKVNYTFSIQAGTFNAPDLMTVRRNWSRSAGTTFNPGSGKVVFDGNITSYIYANETFNELELNKSSNTNRLYVQSARSLTCNSYDWTQGALYVTGGTFTALDLVDNGIYGVINLTSGTINYHQGTSTGSWVDLNADLTISGGTFNIHGGSTMAVFSYSSPATLTMSGGVLDYKNQGITISASFAFDHDITGGTIRTARAFRVQRNDFQPAGGTIELYGSLDSLLENTSGSFLRTVIINKAASRDGEPEAGFSDWETDRQGNRVPLTRANTITGMGPLYIHDLNLQTGTFTAPENTTITSSWAKATAAAFNHGNGTVAFVIGLQTVEGNNHFHDVTKTSGSTLNFNGPTTISGTLTVGTGRFVNFNAAADLATVLNSSSDGYLSFYGTNVSTIESYTGGGRLRCYTQSQVTVSDLTQNGLYGTYVVNMAVLDIHQDSASYIDLNGSVYLLNAGVINLWGGMDDCWIGYNGNVTFQMSSGQFNVKDRGIYIGTSNDVSFDISGGSIRANGCWHDNRGNFQPTGGMVELTGSADTYLTQHPNSWFWNLQINKSSSREEKGPEFITRRDGSVIPIVRANNLTLNACTVKDGLTVAAANVVTLAGTLTSLNAGLINIINGTLDVNEQTVISTGNVQMLGVLKLGAGSSLRLANGKSLTVYTGGTLETIGTAAQAATITRHVSGNYALNLESNGTISAAHTIFEYMDGSGVNIKDGAFVHTTNRLNNCTFRNGASGGRLLTINNAQNFTIDGAYFPTNTWGGAYNVSKTANQGSVMFAGWSGPFGGPAFEQDSHNLIWWEGTGVPPIADLAISYIPATNRIQLDWSYPLMTTGFKIYRSTAPDGAFTLVGTTTSNTWSQIVPGDIYFYRVTAVVP